jgi:hypothetical protein
MHRPSFLHRLLSLALTFLLYDAVRVGAVGEDEARLYNELEVAILRASSLPLGPGDRAPSAYVHFQFLGTQREGEKGLLCGYSSCVLSCLTCVSLILKQSFSFLQSIVHQVTLTN